MLLINIQCSSKDPDQQMTEVYKRQPSIVQHLYTWDGRLRLKPVLVQDADYIVEETYHLSPYLGCWKNETISGGKKHGKKKYQAGKNVG